MPSPADRTLLFASGISSLLGGPAVASAVHPAVLSVAEAASKQCHAYLAGDVAHVLEAAAAACGSLLPSPPATADGVVESGEDGVAGSGVEPSEGDGAVEEGHHHLASPVDVLWTHLRRVCTGYTPSLLRNVSSAVRLDCPTGAGWEDVVGLQDVCRQLQEVVVLPHTRPEVRASLPLFRFVAVRPCAVPDLHAGGKRRSCCWDSV